MWTPVDRAFAVFTERCDEWFPRAYRLGAAERVAVHLERDEARASRIDVRFRPLGSNRTSVTLIHSAFEWHGPA